MEKNLSKQNQIILFDNSFDEKILKKFQNENSIIFSLDHQSHKILVQKEIDHSILDAILDEKNIREIWSKSFSFSKWYEHPEMIDLIKFHEINTGKLFYTELHYYLYPLIKKYLQFIFVCEKYKNYKIIAPSHLSNQLDNLHSQIEYIPTEQKTESFIHDEIKFQLTNSLKINIPINYYKKFKDVSETLLSKFLTNNEHDNTKKQILLIEFDPIKYKDLLKTSKNYDIQLILFNRRRPIIWNKESFDIIKNSNCKVINFDSKSLKSKIDMDKKIFLKNINNILSKDDFFQTFFDLDGHSFWHIIKPFFKKICKKRMLDAIQEISLTEDLMKNSNLSSVIIWSENGFNEQISLELSKKFGIKSMLLQHGMYWETLENKPQNSFLGGIFHDKSDIFLSWGENTKEYFEKCGYSKKSKIIGSPVHDKLVNNISDVVDNDYLLLATSSPQPNEPFDYNIENLELYEKIIHDICKISTGLKTKLIIKLHPFQGELNLKKLIPKNKNIIIKQKGDISSLIKHSKIFMTTDFSTTILDAFLLKKPVISIKTKNRYIKEYPELFRESGIIHCRIDDLKSNIEKLSNSTLKQELLMKNQNFVNNYISLQGNSSTILSKYLSEN